MRERQKGSKTWTLATFTQVDELDELIVRYEEKDRKKVFAAARRLRCGVIVAQADELQIDLDEPSPLDEPHIKHTNHEIYTAALELFDEKTWWSFIEVVGGINALEAWRSRNGNTHVVLTLKRDYTDFERIALQTILGSDSVRELLNWKRVNDGSDCPIALFRPRKPKEE